MHGLFFTSDSLTIEGVEDRSIHIFETQEAADQFAMEWMHVYPVVDHR